MVPMRLERLRENKVFMQNVRLDITPHELFKPRFVHGPQHASVALEVQGFSFYVEGMETPPTLRIMKTYGLKSKTVGEVADVPAELLEGSMKGPGARDIAGMYPIDEALLGWIKQGLEIA